MAAVTRVFTPRRAARMLERDEKLLWDLADRFEPEDGVLWIYEIDNDDGIMAFTDFGLENFKEIIADQIDRKD
ncbi:hypothetical protein GTW51_09890 [Aurantimonas aggregata]|uniref:Uncharacterized protein n=1 Tax=Aurantimonas aggregata TaxID=2047720 RepID=A0A6L9MHK1_9HYPH|nr:hypothetical protein [Aurantimonas aggregata]NDV87012.1 hypothetical protein [Aurantimonas aggregata]